MSISEAQLNTLFAPIQQAIKDAKAHGGIPETAMAVALTTAIPMWKTALQDGAIEACDLHVEVSRVAELFSQVVTAVEGAYTEIE